jgi:hypothetical protein
MCNECEKLKKNKIIKNRQVVYLRYFYTARKGLTNLGRPLYDKRVNASKDYNDYKYVYPILEYLNI